jgi:hypothetical protein
VNGELSELVTRPPVGRVEEKQEGIRLILVAPFQVSGVVAAAGAQLPDVGGGDHLLPGGLADRLRELNRCSYSASVSGVT